MQTDISTKISTLDLKGTMLFIYLFFFWYFLQMRELKPIEFKLLFLSFYYFIVLDNEGLVLIKGFIAHTLHPR